MIHTKLIIHDLDDSYQALLSAHADKVVRADGRYAPCQGCFHCWTKHPATCDLKDSLKEFSRVLGQADELLVITRNCYGGLSPALKRLRDRSIGTSTPLSTYRGGLMHHTLRYGKHGLYRVIAYGDMTAGEEATMRLLTERNAINEGFTSHEMIHIATPDELEGMEF